MKCKIWVDGGYSAIEESAKQQIDNISNMPFIFKHIAIMPDVHYGKGATVGTVIATKGAIIPAAVGVDIGCGMIAVKTTLQSSDLPDNLYKLRCDIEKRIPHGTGKKGDWENFPEYFTEKIKHLFLKLEQIKQQHPKLEISINKMKSQIGTLGGGNHFVEICLDENNYVWVMLHSGSRGTGNSIGSYFIEKAKEDMRRWFITLPDSDLAYITEGSTLFEEYFNALQFAQEYAFLNREAMLDSVIEALKENISKHFTFGLNAINSHHNYATIENHFNENVIITRKGAVSAREGQLGIIPGSMGAKSFIVKGKGNKNSFCSCSHGAGRKMSRTIAKNTFTIEDHIKAVEGIECRKDLDVIDETPGAYKDIDKVMEAQKDLVDIIHILKQVLCVKG